MLIVFLFQAEDGIRYLVRSRGLGDVYKRQDPELSSIQGLEQENEHSNARKNFESYEVTTISLTCLLYTSDAADERSSVDLGGRRIIKKKKQGE